MAKTPEEVVTLTQLGLWNLVEGAPTPFGYSTAAHGPFDWVDDTAYDRRYRVLDYEGRLVYDFWPGEPARARRTQNALNELFAWVENEREFLADLSFDLCDVLAGMEPEEMTRTDLLVAADWCEDQAGRMFAEHARRLRGIAQRRK